MSNEKWGDPRANQIGVEGGYTHRSEKKVPTTRIFGVPVWSSYVETRYEYRQYKGDGSDAPDNVHLKRTFACRCGLIKAINVLSPKVSAITLYLEGRANMHVNIEVTEFVVDLTEDARLIDGPIAEIYFKGEGTRYGELEREHVMKVRLLFSSQEQLERSVVATAAVPDAETRVSYHSSNSSSNSGGSSLWPLATGFALGSLLSND